ncbi:MULTISPECIES: fimbrial protein [Rahnella]|uniref:Type 1 fimbrial protein n=1 Tax=Rahnella laticis TaxID=2787622 RepID=A0ABS0E2W7_9GAMM|nr:MULTISPECIES: fimbrial protein [Rahnella]MBF7979191.1 type 1 fimbrial protein [Rahnella laticis]MBF7999544.1 type 1 fimbrial protein [Rahnella sp. LAC-M12]
MRSRYQALMVTVLLFLPGLSCAADTVITLTGTIKASPCTVDSATKPVNLGEYYVDKIKASGDYIPFSLSLSSCPTGTSTVTATFSGTPDTTSPVWYYANAGTAKNIHIELATDATTPAGLGNGKSMNASVNGTSKAVEFKMKARVNKDDSLTPAPGTILATVNVAFTYS